MVKVAFEDVCQDYGAGAFEDQSPDIGKAGKPGRNKATLITAQ